jgi:hypothetical protein
MTAAGRNSAGAMIHTMIGGIATMNIANGYHHRNGSNSASGNPIGTLRGAVASAVPYDPAGEY